VTVILTPRLVLRRAETRDLAELHAVMTEPEAMRYWSRPAHRSLDETRAYLDSMVGAGPEADDFVIAMGGRVIGKAGAWRLPEIGFILHPAFWGRGLMREALAAVIGHLFAAHPDLDRLTADVDPRNGRSLALLSVLGFEETGRAPRTLQWGDEWCDSVYLALARDDWM
jgi:RimJ/RimL family protein N-acetyltransferase